MSERKGPLSRFKVLDLTRGKKASLEDMPAKGGSNPI